MSANHTTPNPRRSKLERIARQQLGIETLKSRHRDSLDFYDCSVRCIEAALTEAWQAGYAAASTQKEADQ